MPRYIRAKGSVFFFTVVLAERRSQLLLEKIELLRHTYRVVQQRRPFETVAVCVLHGLLAPDWGGDIRDIHGSFGE
jgi:putative transposase